MRFAWKRAMVSWAVATACVAAGTERAPASEPPATGRFVRDGLVIDFEARSPAGKGAPLKEGDIAQFEFRITEEETGRPVRSNVPAAWLDLAEVIRPQAGGEQRGCKDKIALYLRGIVGIRPMVDLNSYHVVLLNQDASLTVVDPLVSMAGSTSTLATVRLRTRGTDWAQHPGAKAIFVTMPEAGAVAVIDTDTYKVKANVPAGASPMRAALQPDGRYLWVGNNADGAASGVTVIDTTTLERAGFVATGSGHHEIAFSADSRLAFVTNRGAGTVSVIDTQSRRKLRDLATGPMPLSIARSSLSGSLYVSDGEAGTVTILDAKGERVGRRLRLGAGLGPLRFTPDGRFAFALETTAGKAHVIDASNDTAVHAIAIGAQPFQVSFSRGFAYVRTLGSERVTMVNLASLGRGAEPIVQSFAAGSGHPGMAKDLVLADSLAPASTEAAMVVVNPVENAAYFYMEGMNAPASSYKVPGGRARAVLLVDRSLKEAEPGVYRGFARLPAPGRYDVAVLLNSPRVVHCFSADVAEDPVLAATRKPTAIDFVSGTGPGVAGERRVVRFRLTDSRTGAPRTGLTDVRVLSFLAPGRGRLEQPAREMGDGHYEAEILLEDTGAYFVRAASPSARFGYQDLSPLTIRVQADAGAGVGRALAGAPAR